MAEPITLDDIYARSQTAQAEVNRRATEAQAEAKRAMEELSHLVDNTTRAVDALTTPIGLFIENLVEPSLVGLFREQGIEICETIGQARSQRPGAEMDIGLLAISDDALYVIEVKDRLSSKDVYAFIGKLHRFKQSFPHYADYQIYGAVAGIEIDEGVDRFAYQRGLFVIKQTGDTVIIANNSTFQPTAW
ncbi:hypothetical protein IQ273_16820 [Nodosilinea sp. LEGE 07298]|uniref:hypothetical protein n=1 Tax=Nodosilinea sp. LEGE 07298 TaxID=2777970 RepID=UPI00187EE7FE|nr:hypothetical protein [Nodosilinea sp. LEGE 07298]MBE9111072.1 hypothetical protein [Nodosilinea sp. LEGE 07298]